MDSLDSEVAAVWAIDAVPIILEVVCRTTGMGFAAVARVTSSRWVACAVRNDVAFPLTAGGELPIETTICDDIRQSGHLVVFDNSDLEGPYCGHQKPALYGFRSYISVPIVLGNGDFFGTLCALDPAPARVNRPEVIGMFTLFARLVALHLDERRRMTALEVEVARRTTALQEANAELERQVAAGIRDRDSLRALTAELERVREDERRGLARDLHDEFGQALTLLKIDLDHTRRTFTAADESVSGPAALRLDVMMQTVESLYDGVQRMVGQLRPIALDTLGFSAAAMGHLTEFEQRTGLCARFEGDAAVQPSDLASAALFRVLQEALTNVSRHAQASIVDVLLQNEDDAVVLHVIDNGRGIKDEDVRKPKGFGLRGMEERLRALNGSLSLERVPAGGTRLVARLPAR